MNCNYETPDMPVTRYFFDISFEGTEYAGWNNSRKTPTVKGMTDKALSVILRCPVRTTGCTQTEKGIHARQFFFHAGISCLPPDLFIQRLNGYLPGDIAVNSITKNIPCNAHARESKISETWECRIHFLKDPFLDLLSIFWPYGVPDLKMMQLAAAFIQSKEMAFPAGGSHVNAAAPEILFSQDQHSLILRFTGQYASAVSVRKLAFAMLWAGSRKISPEALPYEMRNMANSGRVFCLPAKGLHLTGVRYPFDME
ncbi:MAG: hypothetical protein JXA03_11480 [Bacteroidales bacterium]|nr:hypothetical protein [Bacteroidales bacterium]